MRRPDLPRRRLVIDGAKVRQVTGGRQRTVVVTTTSDPERRRCLAGLANASTVTSDARPHITGDTCAIVVDGAEAVSDLSAARVERWVSRGGRLLLIGSPPPDEAWHELTGVASTRELTVGEYVLEPDGHALTTRVDGEVPVVDALRALDTTAARTLFRTVVGAREVTVVAHRAIGDGSVTVAGLDGGHGALLSASLSTVLARSLRASSTDGAATLGVGVVGYGSFGSMGYRHGIACAATPGLRLAAVADADPRRRADAGDAFPEATIHEDAAALVDDDAVDVVVVATPPVSHADLAAQALAAGRHVVVEKPLCLTVADADRLVARAEAHQRVLTVHQNRRWDADFLAITQVVDRGLLGDLFNIETFVGTFEHPCRAWHSEVSVSGGAVYDWGAHHLDWMLLLFGGFPATVQTISHKRVWHDVTNADQLRVRLRWDDGREAEFVDSMLAAVRRPKFYIQGTRGTLVGHYRPLRTETVDPREGYVATDHHHAEAPADLLLARHDAGLGISETRLALPPPPRHAFHRNLADHLLLGEPLAVPPEQARRIVVLLEAAHRSGQAAGPEIRVAP
jgi:predicted dehydrogenase